MDLNVYFKSLVEIDNTAIVICDLSNTIIYMNKFALDSYAKRGINLVGKNLLDCHNDESKEKIKKVIKWFLESKDNNRVHTFFNEKQNKDVYMIALRNENGELVGYYEKHEYRNKDLTPFYEMN